MSWRKKLNHYWAIKFSVISTLLGLLDYLNQVLPFVTEYVPPRTFAALSIIAALGVPIAHIFHKRGGRANS